MLSKTTNRNCVQRLIIKRGSFLRFLGAMAVAAFQWPVFAIAEPINPHNPPQGRFSDEWMEVYLGSNKVGYAHSVTSRDKDVIKTEMSFQMHVERASQKIKLAIQKSTVETLEGTPLEFGSEMDMSIMKTKSKGVVRDGKVTITNTQFGMDTSQTYPFPAGAVMSWGMLRESLIRGFKPGTEYTIEIFEPDLQLNAATKVYAKVENLEKFEYRGKQREGWRVINKLETGNGAMEMLSWIDKDGNQIKSTMPMPGLGDFVMYSCDEAVALAEFAPPEFFMNTVIPVKQSLERGTIKQITYVLKSKNADSPLADFPNTGMQKSERLPDGSIKLVATRQKHEGNKPPAKKTEPAPDMAEFLSSNLMMNVDDPKLIELTKQAKGDATEPFEIGDRLRKFVTEYVSTKSLDVGFATASEVARTREGDCSEHGVLLATLGRICGLPSRVVVGLAYVPIFGGQDDIYGYHMWAQFYINGEWYDFDAALRETDVSPARIAFATSSLKDAGLADLSLPLMGKIGAIDMQILEVDGKPSKESK